MKRTAFLFPGQGSQFVGMGRDLAENFDVARQVFAEVDDTLNQKLSQLMFEGPLEELTKTANTQPALMAVSFAVMKILSSETGRTIKDFAKFAAGHSLGEYSALASAGALSLSDTTHLLRLRGESMQAATPVGFGAMAALLGGTLEKAQELVKAAAQTETTGEICQLANDNSPEQQVISGHAAAVQRAIAMASTFGFRRALPLPVSAPFHCSLMSPAVEKMTTPLEEVRMNTLLIPVISNITAQAVEESTTFRTLLLAQITGQVRWRETLDYLASQEIECVVEVGAGKVLSGLCKRTQPNIETLTLGTPEELSHFIKQLS